MGLRSPKHNRILKIVLKGIAVLVLYESSQRFKRYINLSEIFTPLSPPVTLKMR